MNKPLEAASQFLYRITWADSVLPGELLHRNSHCVIKSLVINVVHTITPIALQGRKPRTYPSSNLYTRIVELTLYEYVFFSFYVTNFAVAVTSTLIRKHR